MVRKEVWQYLPIYNTQKWCGTFKLKTPFPNLYLAMKKLSIIFMIGLLSLVGCNLAEPYAEFNVSEFSVPQGSSIEFYNYSRNAESFLWDFGDGETSTEDNPIHIYNSAGTYTVTLTAFDKNESRSDVYFAKVFVKKFEGVEIRSIYLKDLPSADSLGNSYLNYPYVFPIVIQNGDTLLGSQYWSSKTQLPIQFYNTPNIYAAAADGPCKFELWTSNYTDTLLMGSATLNLNDSLLRPFYNSIVIGDGPVQFELYYSLWYVIPNN